MTGSRAERARALHRSRRWRRRSQSPHGGGKVGHRTPTATRPAGACRRCRRDGVRSRRPRRHADARHRTSGRGHDLDRVPPLLVQAGPLRRRVHPRDRPVLGRVRGGDRRRGVADRRAHGDPGDVARPDAPSTGDHDARASSADRSGRPGAAAREASSLGGTSDPRPDRSRRRSRRARRRRRARVLSHLFGVALWGLSVVGLSDDVARERTVRALERLVLAGVHPPSAGASTIRRVSPARQLHGA